MALVALLAVVLSATPLTLDEALALAARRNPELQGARADVGAAEATVGQRFADVLPTLDLSAAAGVQHVEGSNTTETSGGRYSASLDLVQPIFKNGIANWNALSAQRTREAGARRQLDEATLQVAFNVTRAFYEVVKQQHALEVRRGTAELSDQLVKRADALFSGGRGSKADTYSARANLENDRIAVQAQDAILESARANLASTIGLPSDVTLEVVPPFALSGPGLPPLDEPPPISGLLGDARKNRPLLASLRLAGEAAQTDIQVAQGGYWPSLNLHGSLSRAATQLSGGTGIFAAPGDLYVALAELQLTFNLFAGGATAAGVSLARANASRADASLLRGEASVAEEVEVARARVVTLARSATSLKPLLEASENALRFARELLDAGRSSQLEVRDAALKVEAARLVWVNTVADLVVARADLARSLGAAR